MQMSQIMPLLNAAKDHALKEVRMQNERLRSVQKMGKYTTAVPLGDCDEDNDNGHETNDECDEESESPVKPLTTSRSFMARIRLQSSGSVYKRRRNSSFLKKSFSKSHSSLINV